MKTYIAALAVGMLFLGACADEPDPVAVDETVDETIDDDPIDDTAGVDDFDTLDANGDSSLDEDEIAEWVDEEGVFDQWDSDADSELDEDEIHGNAFALWDSDGDGTITETEWQTGSELFLPADGEVVAMDDLDGDGDSELDADEFAEGFDVSLLGETWSADSLDETAFKQAYFELYDFNDDGQVTSDEFSKGSRFLGVPVS